MRPFVKRHRRTNHTILIVGEGKAECCLVQVLRSLYLPRDSGVSLTIKDGQGFGGQRTLERAQELRTHTPYDSCGIIIDTDGHWTAAERQLAVAGNITPFENAPCLEALLLTMLGERTHAATAANKRAFESKFGNEPHRDGLLERLITREIVDGGRPRIPILRELLSFLHVP